MDSLDLVIEIVVNPKLSDLDHVPLSFYMPVHKPAPIRKKVTIQNLKDIEMEAFRGDILKSELVSHRSDDSTELIELYSSTLSNILGSHAPAKTSSTSLRGIQRKSEMQRSNAERQRGDGGCQS